MILNKHRTQFNLEMTQKELKTLIECLQSLKEIITDSRMENDAPDTYSFLWHSLYELTRFKRYAEAEHKYLAEEEAKADARIT